MQCKCGGFRWHFQSSRRGGVLPRPCGRQSQNRTTKRRQRTIPVGGDAHIDPYGDFAGSPFVVRFWWCILRGRGRAPPLRYDETCGSSKIRTLPLISRLRRQLPPEGKPWDGAKGRAALPRALLYSPCFPFMPRARPLCGSGLPQVPAAPWRAPSAPAPGRRRCEFPAGRCRGWRRSRYRART